MDRTDPVIAFNLGNVLDAQGRRQEAVLAYGQALARDPAFAEAWLNLAAVKEDRPVEAITLYRRALEARPDYPDALFNLAVLLTSLESYADAGTALDRYLSIEPEPEHSGRAKRLAMLCRLGLTQCPAPEPS
jgi:tetratricopeptide (TPR) repeat protein